MNELTKSSIPSIEGDTNTQMYIDGVARKPSKSAIGMIKFYWLNSFFIQR